MAIFWGGGKVLYVDRGGDYAGVYICKNRAVQGVSTSHINYTTLFKNACLALKKPPN